MDRAVFLDRDNTLIANDGDLGDPMQVRLLEGVAEGLAMLSKAGWRLVVVTNQRGVALGKFTEADVDAINQQIITLIEESSGGHRSIERFYYCPYDPDGTVDTYRCDHAWRKPAPGMLLQAAHDLDLDVTESWIIGDQQTDIEAGRAAGCRTLLITPDAQRAEHVQCDATATNFKQAAEHIMNAAPVAPAAGHTAKANTNAGSAAQPESRRLQDMAVGADDAGDADSDIALATHAAERTRKSSATLSTRHRSQALPRAAKPERAGDSVSSALHRAIMELTDELRSARQRSAEFTIMKMAAALCQLLVFLMATLALLHLSSLDTFVQWMAGAVLVQLLAITLLVVDLKG